MIAPSHSSFCMTGKMTKGRTVIEGIITAQGFHVAKKIKHSNYLVVGNMTQFKANMTVKLREALDAGWRSGDKIISEEQLYNLLGIGNVYITSLVEAESRLNLKNYVDKHFNTSAPTTLGQTSAPAKNIPTTPAKKTVFIDSGHPGKKKEEGATQLPDIPVEKNKHTAEDLGVDVSDIFSG